MRSYSANAIVLRRIDLGEKDRILTLYTREAGKLPAVAKGSRRPGSKLAGPSEPFTYSKLALARGRDLDVISQADTRECFPNIRSNMLAVAYAVYVLELVGSFVDERQPNPDIYDTLLSALYVLESGTDPEITARYFELQLLAVLGYEPVYESCIRCARSVDPGAADVVAFSAAFGGLICSECGAPPGDIVQANSAIISYIGALRKAEPHKLKDMRFPKGARRDLANILRRHIRYRLEHNLKSVDFIGLVEALENGQPDERSDAASASGS